MAEPIHAAGDRPRPLAPESEGQEPSGSTPDPADVTSSEASADSLAAADESEPSGWRVLWEIVVVLGTALVLSIVVRAFLVQAFYVPSASMENTLMPSDRIIASKITTRFSGVNRGEVVVFRDPGGWLPEPAPPKPGLQTTLRSILTFIGLLPSDSGKDLVKRVIAVGGDRIRCCDKAGHIVLNGQPLIEPYIKDGDPTDQVRFDVRVPEGRMFVMGDNRSDSRDSRYHLEDDDGTVPMDNVVGRVVLIVWPFDRFSTVPIPESFASIPPGP